MADFTSSRRSAMEGSQTPLGGAPSGSPSGSPWPTGAYAYAAGIASPATGDSLSAIRIVGKIVLGVTGPQASGPGVYFDLSFDPQEHDVLTRVPIPARGSAVPIGTSYIPTAGYYGLSPSANIFIHDGASILEKTAILPLSSGSGSVFYRLRARDSAGPLNDPTRFVYWTSAVLSLASYTGPLPFGGPLVELTIMDSFSGT